MTEIDHQPVMLQEVLELLQPQPGALYIDATLGLGGHAQAILEATAGQCRLWGIDRDADSLALAEKRLAPWAVQTRYIHSRFSQLPALVQELGSAQRGCLRGVLFDLGISSRQLNDESYGLSFRAEHAEQPLDMRLDPWCPLSAAQILNQWSLVELTALFRDLADLPGARRLAQRIVERRPLHTVGQFSQLCRGLRGGSPRLNPATLPLMALRIAVNDELGEISRSLPKLAEVLEPGCKILVISFHSGEDRLIKHLPKISPTLQALYKKPLIPSQAEIRRNRRARSAKLRAFLKV